jgi:ligand-binding SRPBCC domain-containing protein
MRFSFQTEQWLSYPVELVFDFFANPGNLPLLMPAWQKARIEKSSLIYPLTPSLNPNSGTTSRFAGPGSRFTLSFRPFPYSPFRLYWLAEITGFSWNEYFCDRQLRGPFASWNHCHYVRRLSKSGVDGTLIADDIEYEVPFDLVGHLAHGLFLRRQIESSFAFRQIQLARLLARAKSQDRQAQPLQK